MTASGARAPAAAGPMIVERDLPIPMDDGLILRADVFRPPGPGPFPVIMSLGPYGKSLPFASEWFAARWERLRAEHPEIAEGSSCAHMNWETVDPEQWIPNGYAVVRADSRGAGRSPGRLDLLSAREIGDYYLAIEWAGTRAWSNGRVGLCGISYYAMNQWLVAALRPPHLAAILPWEGASDHYRDMSHHGGILSNGFFERWYPRQVLPIQHGRGTAGPPSPWTSDGLATGPETIPDGELQKLRADYLGGVRGHALDDAWHAERRADLGRIQVPLLSAANWGGLGLHSRGNFEGYAQAGSAAKWLEVHTGRHEELFYTEHGRGLQRRFFGHFLKGEDNGWDAEPAVQLAIRHADGTIRHRGEEGWPLPRTAWTRRYLDADDAALGSAPPEAAGSAGFDGRGDGVTFTAAPLPAPLELTGPLLADLHVSTEGDDADLFLTLRAFAPDGQEVTFRGANDPRAPLSQGWLRLSHRAVDAARSRPWRPWHPHQAAEPVRPGQAYPVAVEMWPTCVVLPAGYRLALTVAARDFARPDPSDDGFRGSGPFAHDDPADRPAARAADVTRIHTGARTPSSLLLPVIP